MYRLVTLHSLIVDRRTLKEKDKTKKKKEEIESRVPGLEFRVFSPQRHEVLLFFFFTGPRQLFEP
jgi:hypothetical protein